MRTESYTWYIYGADLSKPKCKVVASIVDDSHSPPEWQETLEGQRKVDAIKIIQEDIATANTTGRFTQSTIDEAKRWYWRTIQPSGRSRWEVMLDESGNPLPNPCENPSAPKPGNFDIVLRLAGISFRQDGTKVIVTIVGEGLIQDDRGK